MKHISCVVAFVLVCIGADAEAQVSASQLEKIHRSLEELRARNEFLELIARAGREERDELRGRHSDELRLYREQLEKMHKGFVADRKSAEARNEELESELQRVEATNRHLRKVIQDERHVSFDQDVDGRIVSVAHSLKTVEVDLGHADDVFVGLQLDVLFPFELIDRDPSDAEVALLLLLQERCRIEVIRVDSANRSTAKVLPGANMRSLQTGAAVATPLWNRRQRHTVALLEFIGNADVIKQTLWAAGLETRELASDPNSAELINAQTRYVVVADFNRILQSDDTTAAKNYSRELAKARTFAIPVLDVKRLLTLHPIPESRLEEAVRMQERYRKLEDEKLQEKIEQVEAANKEKELHEQTTNGKSKPAAEKKTLPQAREMIHSPCEIAF